MRQRARLFAGVLLILGRSGGAFLAPTVSMQVGGPKSTDSSDVSGWELSSPEDCFYLSRFRSLSKIKSNSSESPASSITES